MSESAEHRLLFVCTGNICRSPMAHVIAEHYAKERGWSVAVQSGGVLNIVGKPAESNAIKVMKEAGIDLSRHRSSGLDQEKLDWADYVLVMELQHSRKLHNRFERTEEKVLMLGSFGGILEIADPIGSWKWRFRRTREDLIRCVEGFMDHLPPPEM